ncbi:MAG TPA: universal stress protein [Polyangiaceae bacterium]
MTQPHPIQKPYVLLVAIDYSEISALALTEAVRLAAPHERSQIHVVHALPPVEPLAHGLDTPDLASAALLNTPPPPSGPGFIAAMSHDLQAYVEKVLTQAAGPGNPSSSASSPSWTMHFRISDPTTAIVQLASDLEADLVIVGTHGRSWLARFLLGSVAEAVARRAPCPVLIVRPVGAGADAAGPQIEPPCPQCLETRRASEGREFWCERHREHHERAHTYHFTPFRSSHQSGMLLHPLK